MADDAEFKGGYECDAVQGSVFFNAFDYVLKGIVQHFLYAKYKASA